MAVRGIGRRECCLLIAARFDHHFRLFLCSFRVVRNQLARKRKFSFRGARLGNSVAIENYCNEEWLRYYNLQRTYYQKTWNKLGLEFPQIWINHLINNSCATFGDVYNFWVEKFFKLLQVIKVSYVVSNVVWRRQAQWEKLGASGQRYIWDSRTLLIFSLFWLQNQSPSSPSTTSMSFQIVNGHLKSLSLFFSLLDTLAIRGEAHLSCNQRCALVDLTRSVTSVVWCTKYLVHSTPYNTKIKKSAHYTGKNASVTSAQALVTLPTLDKLLTLVQCTL